ncbi:MAG TPA: helix-turn-helix transcriptional regulator [Solirubrobacteraceae bacterium]|nr:helix-turn-helix transcriptional regulator [Solirubrobacteraceae bacterium]
MSLDDALVIARARELLASGEGRVLRKKHRMSQPAMADAIGVTAATIHNWETGTRNPPSTSIPFTRYAHLLAELASLGDEQPSLAHMPSQEVVGK